MQRHSSRLYRLVYRHVQRSDAAKDILQDIFIAVWNNRARIIVKDSLYPYLYRSAKNAVIDHALAARRHVPLYEEEYDQLPGTLTGVEDHLHVQELERALQQSIRTMPDTMRTVMILSREERLSSREIAARLNISEQTVRNNISMALHRLRQQLGLPVVLVLLPSGLVFGNLVTLS